MHAGPKRTHRPGAQPKDGPHTSRGRATPPTRILFLSPHRGKDPSPPSPHPRVPQPKSAVPATRPEVASCSCFSLATTSWVADRADLPRIVPLPCRDEARLRAATRDPVCRFSTQSCGSLALCPRRSDWNRMALDFASEHADPGAPGTPRFRGFPVGESSTGRNSARCVHRPLLRRRHGQESASTTFDSPATHVGSATLRPSLAAGLPLSLSSRERGRIPWKLHIGKWKHCDSVWNILPSSVSSSARSTWAQEYSVQEPTNSSACEKSSTSFR
jgi:hypothetical protein